MTPKQLVAALCILGFLAVSSGCSSDHEKICKHIAKLVEKRKGKPIKPHKYERCLAKVKAGLSECKNKSEIVNCFLALESHKGQRACRRLCKK